jgi:hypothetical protein
VIEESPRLVVEDRRPEWPARREDSRKLLFYVLYTRTPNTIQALERAAETAKDVNARIVILAMQTVPYPVALTEPPVSIDFLRRKLWTLALGIDADTAIQIYLCRDVREALRRVLAPRSTVFLGDGGWWFAPERRLARSLLRDGHVAFLITPSPRSHHDAE